MAASIGISPRGGNRLASWLLLAAALAGLTACPGRQGGEPAASKRPSILLVTVDSLRADRVGFAGHAQARTPNLDALAARSARFTTALAPAPLTTPSLASLHTGMLPSRHGVRLDDRHALSSEAATLAEALQSAGYKTAAIASTLSLHPKFGLAQGFGDYLESFAEIPRPREAPIQHFAAARVVARALEWLEGSYRGDFFLWVNFHDPHYFYAPPSPFDKEFADRPYDGEIAYVDQELGKLFARLREYGIDDRTLVVVAGSHGEGLGEHGELYHGTLLFESTLRVPLVMKPAGAAVQGRDVPTPVSLVDVMPTLLEAAGVDAPASLDGRSLAAALSGGPPDVDPERPLLAETALPSEHFGWAPLAAARSGRWKYIAAPAPRLHDLESDPSEERDVAAEHPEVAARLAREAARITFQAPACSSCAEQAQALGFPWPPAGRRGPPVDPHDRIDVANDALRAHRTFQRKQAEPAMLLYREVLARDPDNRVALLEHGWLTALGKQGEGLRPSLDMLLKAQRLYGQEGEIYHLIGHLEEAMTAGKVERSRTTALYRLAFTLDPLNEEALYDAACGVAVAGRAQEALDLLARSIGAGFRDFRHMHADSDLASIRGEARFAQLVPAVQER
ncbi:MAG TPA: sulfatase, partial [Candidatus Polarisedimenticolia bacterium]|nr:sulfatase [Candidatus Polarisedimenticolia bacterium]